MTYKPSPELIKAVRRCAEAGKSTAEAADELTTRVHPLTRNAIIGLAHRNGIKFPKKIRTYARKPKDRRTIPDTLDVRDYGAVADAPVFKPSFGSIARNVRAPHAGCSWVGCTSHAVEGDMFCYQHYKKQLVS